MQVLLLEDNPFDADLIRRALRRHAPEIQVTHAKDVALALAWLRSDEHFDLILSDLHLIDGDGFSVLIHVLRHNLPVPVVFMTGSGDETRVVAALKAGADDYLIKSLEQYETLHLTLHNALERYHLHSKPGTNWLRVLYAEDDQREIERTQLRLSRSAPNIQLEAVQNQPALLALLEADTDFDFDVLLVNYRLLGLDPLGFLHSVRRVRGLDVPVIFVTGLGDEEHAVRTIRHGATDYLVKDPATYYFRLPLAIENAVYRKQLAHEQAAIRALNAELISAYDATLKSWSIALELRDHETEGHTRRVTEMTVLLAQSMGFSGEALEHIRRGALLHDIGKMGVPDSVLLKPGPLEDHGWAIMRRHPEYAQQWLSAIPFLNPALDIPYAHHERWDGSGYPQGLQGEEIPISARIFAVVDIWDALTTNRPYRKAWTHKQAREHIESLSGTHLDPEVVRAFSKLLQSRERNEVLAP